MKILHNIFELTVMNNVEYEGDSDNEDIDNDDESENLFNIS